VLLVLFGTYGPKAQIVMSSTTSSTNAILRLAKICANRSRTRIISLKERLFSITKGDSNACDYLCSIRSVGDELALIGHCVDDLDLIIVALNGLGPAYCEFCSNLHLWHFAAVWWTFWQTCWLWNFPSTVGAATIVPPCYYQLCFLFIFFSWLLQTFNVIP